MTTMEKLFLQIFERKDWIIEQVQQQADAYTQQLASRLLIDGITPPPWLLNPSFNSCSLNPNGLEKEEIISRLLLQPSRDSVPYSSGGFSRYYQSVVAGGNGQLSTDMCMETHAHNQGGKVSNEPLMMLECHNNDTRRSLNCVLEQDDSVNSPQNETDARISSIYAAPDTSLARIQRSKSRQKARELRSNAKTAAKSSSCFENRAHISFSGDSMYKSDIHEITQDKFPSGLDQCIDISGANSVATEGKGDKENVGTSYSGIPARSSSSYEKPSCLNDHPKTSLSSEKEVPDGSILVPPTGKSLEQSGLLNGAMEDIDLPDVSLGSYAAKKSITGKTQDAQRQSKLYSGRITRSRSAIQQTCGINKSPKLGKSSCNIEEGRGALPVSVGDLTHRLDASNELLDAVETSQVLSDRIGETQSIHSNEGILKPVIPSNIAALRVTSSRSGSIKEHLVGANHQENVEMVVGDVPMNEPVVMQPVNSGIKLDPVTVCAESGGLASRQSSECLMIVKPKQLNFDEVEECDLSVIRSPLSKKRKLSGLSAQECYPSKESASSTDHKYNGTFFEQQSPMGMALSSKSKAARTHPQNNIDECAKDETMNIRLDKSENPVVEEVEHNSTFSLHHDVDVSCEVDLGHKGEESAVYIPEPENTKSLFISSLTKQVNKDYEDCFDNEERIPEQDISSIKSKEFEVGMNTKLSNLELNSAKVGTWPWKLQREVEDQPTCFSDSRGFRVHIQRDAIHCDLEVPENDLRSIGESASVLSSEKIHVSHSNGIQSCDKEVHLGMMWDLREGTESLHMLQASEATVTEVDDDTSEIPYTLEQSGPTRVLNMIENADDDSTYSLAVDGGAANPASNDEVAVADNLNTERRLPERMSCLGRDCRFSYGSFQCLRNDDKTAVGSNETMSVYEGFIIDEQVENAGMENAEGEIDFATLEIPSSTFARASILEQICKSASMQTPLSRFSSTLKQHQIQDLYGFVEHGFLEHMDLGSNMSLEEDSRKHLRASDSHITEVDSAFPKQENLDLLPFSSTPFCWQSKNHYSSPVGKFWERSASSSGSSEKQLSSNPELTCFPIEEDPSSKEESENAEESDELQESIISGVANDVERGPPTKPAEVHFQHPITVSTEMKIARRENDDEVAVEINEGFVSRIKDEVAESEAPLKSTEVCSQHVNPMSTAMKYSDRCISYCASKEASLKKKPKNHPGIKVSRYEENRTSSIATRASSRGNVSLQSEYSKIKSSMRKGIPRPSQKEATRNNIVSNITSFIPMVQQKQAAAVCAGKRDIKVKALEAAEAAKRREQEKENERKMKKEALKLERARMEKENAREMELNKKKMQEELKKKEADLAARKRQREEDERKQMAKKRKHVAEARKEQKLQYEKSRAGKVEMEKQHAKNAAIAGNKKVSDNATEIPRQNRNADERSLQRNDTGLRTDENLTSAVQQVTSVLENCGASNGDCGGKEKATSMVEKSPVKVGSTRLTSQEKSYDISPYQCSDDEDDEEDDIPTKKFVPSWASKHRVAMVLPLQQTLDPETIFPAESFCRMDEVLLPRRLKAQ